MAQSEQTSSSVRNWKSVGGTAAEGVVSWFKGKKGKNFQLLNFILLFMNEVGSFVDSKVGSNSVRGERFAAVSEIIQRCGGLREKKGQLLCKKTSEYASLRNLDCQGMIQSTLCQ